MSKRPCVLTIPKPKPKPKPKGAPVGTSRVVVPAFGRGVARAVCRLVSQSPAAAAAAAAEEQEKSFAKCCLGRFGEIGVEE